MTQSCPKCRYVRLPTDTAPDWQCPSCGVAYAKAADSARSYTPPTAWTPAPRNESAVPWGKAFALVAIVAGAWFGLKGGVSRLGGDSHEAIATLAASVKPGDVTMYVTKTCGYCHQAAGWLNQNGFAFKSCDVESDASCRADYLRYAADGTPYLVVKGHHMKQGFNTDEFLAALRAKTT